ncbi:hypothetical protein GLF_0811 [Gluconobacter frateurii NBRC 101659]|nr:hypothetical protein GLF_0811 [Gluconobacter frateurii NBRC 101659]
MKTTTDLAAKRRQSRIVGIAGGVITLAAIFYVITLIRF